MVERKVWSFIDELHTTEITFTRDSGNDGSIEQLERTIESSAGDPLEWWDGDGDGGILNYRSWTYDCGL